MNPEQVNWPAEWNGKYRVILADPPWDYGGGSLPTGKSKNHYTTIPLETLARLPVGRLATDNSILFLWGTFPLLHKIFDVMKAWGFQYKTVGFTWVKTNKDGKIFTGLGHYTRGNAEVCLIGVKGRVADLVKHNDVNQIIMSQRRKHSQKPDEQYARIERMFDGPYLELFARNKWQGWDSWGDELDNPEGCGRMELVSKFSGDTIQHQVLPLVPVNCASMQIMSSSTLMKVGGFPGRENTIFDLLEARR